MRRFEKDYRINEGDDVLDRENAIHRDVDMRLDAIEELGREFADGNRIDVDAILRAMEGTFSDLASQMQAIIDATAGQLSADVVIETATRTFLTAQRRAAILADLRGEVDPDGDTLAKLYALVLARATPADLDSALSGVRGGVLSAGDTLAKLYALVLARTTPADVNSAVISIVNAAIASVKGSADAAHDTLGELAALVDANTLAVATKADAAATADALANRLRIDAGQALSLAQRLVPLTSLGIDGTETDITAAATVDIGASLTQSVRIIGASATITSFGSGSRKFVRLRFAGSYTLTRNTVSLEIEGRKSITLADGDTADARQVSAGNWVVFNIRRADGTSVVRPNLINLAFSAADFYTNGSFAPYGAVDFVATGTAAFVTAGCSFYHASAAQVDCALYIGLLTQADVAIYNGPQQGTSIVNQTGYGGSVTTGITYIGLTPGATYRLSPFLYRGGNAGPTQIREGFISGFTF